MSFHGKKAVVVHTGFMTYLLIVVMGIIVIGIIDPPLFQQMMSVVSQMAKAMRGG